MKSLCLIFIVACSLSLSAKTGITRTKKPVRIWVYTGENKGKGRIGWVLQIPPYLDTLEI